MEIITRKAIRYKDVSIKEGNTLIEMGLLDEDECMELAKQLKITIEQLIGPEEFKTLMTSDE